MVLSDLEKTHKLAIEITEDAIETVEDSTQGEDLEALKSAYDEIMDDLLHQYVQTTLEGVFNCLDNQEWDQLQNHREEFNSEEWSTILESYIKHRLKKGQAELKRIEQQLILAEKKLSEAQSAEVLSNYEEYLKNALQKYKEIDQEEILEAQRDISRAENVYKKYGNNVNRMDFFEKQHAEANRVDEDVKEVENKLKDMLRRLEN